MMRQYATALITARNQFRTNTHAGMPGTLFGQLGPHVRANPITPANRYSRTRLRSAALTRSSSDDPTPVSAKAARDATRASENE
jgi:hypothetical protein